MLPNYKNQTIKVILITTIICSIFFGTAGVVALTLYADDIIYNPSNSNFNANTAEDALNELYELVQNTSGTDGKIESLGTSTTHSYDMKALYPNEYQNFTVDDFVVEVKTGSNQSSSYNSDSYLSRTDHNAISVGTYTLNKNYNQTTGIFTASATISSSGHVARYNGNYWAHSGASYLTSSVYFLK